VQQRCTRHRTFPSSFSFGHFQGVTRVKDEVHSIFVFPGCNPSRTLIRSTIPNFRSVVHRYHSKRFYPERPLLNGLSTVIIHCSWWYYRTCQRDTTFRLGASRRINHSDTKNSTKHPSNVSRTTNYYYSSVHSPVAPCITCCRDFISIQVSDVTGIDRHDAPMH
jgi:hypothetical protein